MTFRREAGKCLSSTVRKESQNWFAFSTDENSKHWNVQQYIMGGQC